MCDLRIAAQSARFIESFVNLGIVAGDGGAWLLPRVAGKSKALEMALTGASVPGDEALACGLVSKVVADEDLMSACISLRSEEHTSELPSLMRISHAVFCSHKKHTP